jgi:RHS repeat-associated protein
MRYFYDDANRLDRVEHFNAMETGYSWDDADRLTGIAHQGAKSLVEYSFQLDANGNRIQEVISPAPMVPGSLTTEDTSFHYNHQHNRLNSTSTHRYMFDDQGQLSSTIDTLANHYTYDNEGQLTTNNGVGYSFDDAHRLIHRGSDSFVYDGVGNRVKALRGAEPNRVETQYIYDASGNLLAEANSAGQISRYFIYGAGLAAMAQGNTYYVYHFDGTGHTVALTSASNVAVNKYAYSPYGKVTGEEQIAQPFKYAGQVGIFTESASLYYMRARYYDAETGRFISEDPAGFVDGPNLYAYVGGNPIRLVDPTGLSADEFGVFEGVRDGGSSLIADVGVFFGYTARSSGLYGRNQARRANIEGQFADRIIRECMQDAQCRSEVDQAARNYIAANDSSYFRARIITRAALGIISGTGPAGIHGAVDNALLIGATTAEELIPGIIYGQ